MCLRGTTPGTRPRNLPHRTGPGVPARMREHRVCAGVRWKVEPRRPQNQRPRNDRQPCPKTRPRTTSNRTLPCKADPQIPLTKLPTNNTASTSQVSLLADTDQPHRAGVIIASTGKPSTNPTEKIFASPPRPPSPDSKRPRHSREFASRPGFPGIFRRRLSLHSTNNGVVCRRE